MKTNSLFEKIKNILAVIGLLSVIGTVGVSFFLFHHYPARKLGKKAFKKAGLDNTVLAKFFDPKPVRPAGLQFPAQDADGWTGWGARKSRQLVPVRYYKDIRPVPLQWETIAGLAPITEQHVRRIVKVKDAGQLITAIKKAMPGDQILLAPGTYRIRAYNITINAAGTPQFPICVTSAGLGLAKIKLDTFEGFLVNAPYWIFENLDIEGVRKNHGRQEHAFHIIGNGRGFVLRNSRVHEFNSIIKANGTKNRAGETVFPDNVLIEDNTLYNSAIRMTSKPVTFIDVVGASNWTVRGNFISDFAKGEGDRISYAAFFKGNSSYGVFENNLVIGEYRTSGGTRVGLSLGGGGTGKKFFRAGRTDIEHSNGIIRNNVVMYCTDVAVYLNKAANTKIYNNTFYKTMGIDIRYRTSSAEIKNNILTGRIKNRNGGSSQQENNLIVSDGFFSSNGFSEWFNAPERADFSLKKKGPFIDRGEPLPQVYEDICGEPRSGIPDIGAFEYNNSPVCTLIGVKQDPSVTEAIHNKRSVAQNLR